MEKNLVVELVENITDGGEREVISLPCMCYDDVLHAVNNLMRDNEEKLHEKYYIRILKK